MGRVRNTYLYSKKRYSAGLYIIRAHEPACGESNRIIENIQAPNKIVIERENEQNLDGNKQIKDISNYVVQKGNIKDSLKKNDKTKNNELTVQEFSKESEKFYNDINDKDCRNKNNKISENERFSSGDFSQIINELTMLKDVQRQIFYKVLDKFRLLFSEKPGCAKGYEHRLKITVERPRICHNYPIPLALRESTKKAIEKMIQDGVIERGISQYCNPLRIIKKQDGSVRVCLDARWLNKVIEDDQESLPLINELIQKYYGAQWFSKIDLTQGYWQVSLDKYSRPFTAFLFDSKTYQFCRVPFGLKTAGSGFMRALSFALKDICNENMSCYIDDILIGTKTFEEHISIMTKIFQKLIDYNFTLNLSKCIFLQKKISFLGFEISAKGFSPEQKGLEIINNFQEPKNKRQLQQFLGICNYYRQFNVRHSISVDALRELLRKEVGWNWTQVHTSAFKTIKEDFSRCITLKHIIPGVPFRLQTDASDHGIAGILYQVDEIGDHNVVGIVSRCLSRLEMKYTTTEKELLVIIYSIGKFRVYLIGRHFEIVTDHRSLTFLQSASFQSGRIMRWILLLQQYTFSVTYCRGIDNVVADFFSRNPEGKFIEENHEQMVISSLHQFPANK